MLGNLKAFLFYATPLQGSNLAKLVCLGLFSPKSPRLFSCKSVEDLEVTNVKVQQMVSQFEEIRQNVGKGAWKFYGVGETRATSYVR